MYLRNKNLGRMTEHTQIGIDSAGNRQYQCIETGDIQTLGTSRASKIRAEKLRSERIERDKELGEPVVTHGVSNENVQKLRDFLQRDSQTTVTANE